METVLITGGTGLVGTALVNKLIASGYKVIVLTRKKGLKGQGNIHYAYWDVDGFLMDEQAIAAADYIIHLAGANVGEKRWTKERKEEILKSRVRSAELLCDALGRVPHKVKAVISASAIGWYGPDPVIPNPRPFKEDAPHANDYLGETCYKWEQAIKPVETNGIRLAILRTGIVLDADGGALKEFARPLKAGLATVLGSGRQMISWVHIDDLVQIYLCALESESFHGVYNAVAPDPVSNRQLVTVLAEQKRGRFYIPLPVPAFALKIVLGEMSIEVLKSTTVSCEKLLSAGFAFSYPTVHDAIRQIVKR